MRDIAEESRCCFLVPVCWIYRFSSSQPFQCREAFSVPRNCCSGSFFCIKHLQCILALIVSAQQFPHTSSGPLVTSIRSALTPWRAHFSHVPKETLGKALPVLHHSGTWPFSELRPYPVQRFWISAGWERWAFPWVINHTSRSHGCSLCLKYIYSLEFFYFLLAILLDVKRLPAYDKIGKKKKL